MRSMLIVMQLVMVVVFLLASVLYFEAGKGGYGALYLVLVIINASMVVFNAQQDW